MTIFPNKQTGVDEREQQFFAFHENLENIQSLIKFQNKWLYNLLRGIMEHVSKISYIKLINNNINVSGLVLI